MIVSSIDVMIQVAGMRDGSRRITHVTEFVGMEGDVVTMQDLFLYEFLGEDQNGKILAASARPASVSRGSGIAPAISARRRSSPRRSMPPRSKKP